MPLPDFAAVPGLPQDDEGVVFAAPWEAKAFALVIHLHQQGSFEWKDWVKTLAGEIAADLTRTVETPYYQLWLNAVETLVAARGLIDATWLETTRAELLAVQSGEHDDDHDHDHHGAENVEIVDYH